MSSEQNAAFVRRWFDEVWNQGREEAVDEMLAEHAVGHGVGDTPIRGPADFRPYLRAFRSAVRDLHVDVEDVISEGDRVAVRCSGRLTFADGRTVNLDGGGFIRLENGKIVEAWNQWNYLDMLTDMGDLPPGFLLHALAKRRGGRDSAPA